MHGQAIKKIWDEGGVAVGCMLMADSPIAAETMAHAGFDFLIVDRQHGGMDEGTAIAMMTAISTTATVPFLRVPSNDAAAIGRALDCGAGGIIAPLTDTAVDARAIVAATRYPPDGKRSWGPVRAGLTGGPDYAAEANQAVIASGMIETRDGFDALDEILATPNLDSLLVGPNDLGFSYGNLPKPMPDDPQVVKAIETVAKKANDAGVMPGIHCGDAAMANRMIALGYRWISLSTDTLFLRGAVEAALGQLKR
jgi:4-hydroxy-2-oxoheptanedioate aldolase